MSKWSSLVLSIACCLAVACSGGTGGSNDSDGGGDGGTQQAKHCTANADCGAHEACLIIGDTGGCVPTCSASANECSGEAECGGVGATTIDVCKAKPPTNEEPKAEEQPKIPCANDLECTNLANNAPGTVCAEWKGAKDCTITCSVESDCDLPNVGGFVVDYLTCATDEGNPSRKVCVPDERCFASANACVHLPDFQGDGGSCKSNGDLCGNSAGGSSCCSGLTCTDVGGLSLCQ